MEKEELENILKIYEENLSNIKRMYLRAVESYLHYDTHINSKIIRDSGLHLINLALEMKSLESKIEMLKKIKDKSNSLDTNIKKTKIII